LTHSELTVTLKLPFYRLNAVKAAEFDRLTAVNTEVANDLLKVEKAERKKLTSSAFRHIEKGRIPLAVHQASHAELLDRAIAGEAKFGSIKLCKSRKGIWYALISVSMEVPDAGQVNGWIGVDRGQNNIAVAALPNGFGRFWKAGRVKSLRRRFQKLRKELQEAQKTRKVKQLERRERRMMTQINHEISKQLVQFAKDFGMGLRFEDLSGIRQNSKQQKKAKSDAGNNRDHWAYYQLEKFTMYKAIREGVPFEKIPPAYTSKSDHRNGMIGKRVKHWFIGHDGYCCNADWNAAQNISQWVGFACPLDLQKAVAVMTMADPGDGVNDSPLTGEKSKMAALAPS
jgi:IS605 OrfB family transposase